MIPGFGTTELGGQWGSPTMKLRIRSPQSEADTEHMAIRFLWRLCPLSLLVIVRIGYSDPILDFINLKCWIFTCHWHHISGATFVWLSSKSLYQTFGNTNHHYCGFKHVEPLNSGNCHVLEASQFPICRHEPFRFSLARDRQCQIRFSRQSCLRFGDGSLPT